MYFYYFIIQFSYNFLEHNAVQPSIMYNLIKHSCDQKYGIVSQCFKADYINEQPGGYFENLLLKVNGKIGGQNIVVNPQVLNELPFNYKRTMILGVDVNHPGATEKVLSSIAVAVGSYDPLFTYYSASIRIQKKERDEMIRQMDSMVEELLEEYKKKNNQYPENLFIFRDGVSEGQFDKVENIEIPLIQKMINKLGKKIKLTLVVVQKRHHTRFVRLEVDSSQRRPTYNVPSGTVVDQGIVEPNKKIFYLNSHFSPLVSSKKM